MDSPARIPELSEYALNILLGWDSSRESYSFRYTPEAVYLKELSRLSTVYDVNAHYWHDMTRMMGAFMILTNWRAAELASDTVLLLDERRILAPTAIARSLIELFAKTADLVTRFCDGVKRAKDHWVDAIYTVDGLEVELNRCLFSTGLPSETSGASYFPDFELKKKHVNDYLRPLEKIEGQEFIKDTYDYLCAFVHPNAAGNLRFLNEAPFVHFDGRVSYELRRAPALSSPNTATIHHVLRTIGWSSYYFVKAGTMVNDATMTVADAFPLSRKH